MAQQPFTLEEKLMRLASQKADIRSNLFLTASQFSNQDNLISYLGEVGFNRDEISALIDFNVIGQQVSGKLNFYDDLFKATISFYNSIKIYNNTFLQKTVSLSQSADWSLTVQRDAQRIVGLQFYGNEALVPCVPETEKVGWQAAILNESRASQLQELAQHKLFCVPTTTIDLRYITSCYIKSQKH